MRRFQEKFPDQGGDILSQAWRFKEDLTQSSGSFPKSLALPLTENWQEYFQGLAGIHLKQGDSIQTTLEKIGESEKLSERRLLGGVDLLLHDPIVHIKYNQRDFRLKLGNIKGFPVFYPYPGGIEPLLLLTVAFMLDIIPLPISMENQCIHQQPNCAPDSAYYHDFLHGKAMLLCRYPESHTPLKIFLKEKSYMLMADFFLTYLDANKDNAGTIKKMVWGAFVNFHEYPFVLPVDVFQNKDGKLSRSTFKDLIVSHQNKLRNFTPATFEKRMDDPNVSRLIKQELGDPEDALSCARFFWGEFLESPYFEDVSKKYDKFYQRVFSWNKEEKAAQEKKRQEQKSVFASNLKRGWR